MSLKPPTLQVELVPFKAWERNVRTKCPPKTWDRIRRSAYRRAGYRCSICGESGKDQGREWPVECHELWEYDDKKHIQRLAGVTAICPACHGCKHYGLSQLRGLEDECIKHLMKVNKMPLEAVMAMVHDAFEVWHKRSQYEWELDIKWLEQAKKHL